MKFEARQNPSAMAGLASRTGPSFPLEFLLEAKLFYQCYLSGPLERIAREALPPDISARLFEGAPEIPDSVFTGLSLRGERMYGFILPPRRAGACYLAYCDGSMTGRGEHSCGELEGLARSYQLEKMIGAAATAELASAFASFIGEVSAPIADLLKAEGIEAPGTERWSNGQLGVLEQTVLAISGVRRRLEDKDEDYEPPEAYKRFCLICRALIGRARSALEQAVREEPEKARKIGREVLPDVMRLLRDGDLSGLKRFMERAAAAALSVTAWGLRREVVLVQTALNDLPEIPRQIIELYLALRLGGVEAAFPSLIEAGSTTAMPLRPAARALQGANR